MLNSIRKFESIEVFVNYLTIQKILKISILKKCLIKKVKIPNFYSQNQIVSSGKQRCSLFRCPIWNDFTIIVHFGIVV